MTRPCRIDTAVNDRAWCHDHQENHAGHLVAISQEMSDRGDKWRQLRTSLMKSRRICLYRGPRIEYASRCNCPVFACSKRETCSPVNTAEHRGIAHCGTCPDYTTPPETT